MIGRRDRDVFDAADVGFVRQIQVRRSGESAFASLSEMTGIAEEVALLWEADPELFAERYPDSGIVESYGEQWPTSNASITGSTSTAEAVRLASASKDGPTLTT